MKYILIIMSIYTSNLYACGGTKNTYFLNGFSTPVRFNYDGEKIEVGGNKYIKKGDNIYEIIGDKIYKLHFLISRGLECSPREGNKIEVSSSEIE